METVNAKKAWMAQDRKRGYFPIKMFRIFFLLAPDAFEKTMQGFKQLDVVCNNAGIGREFPDWKTVIDINLVRTFDMS